MFKLDQNVPHADHVNKDIAIAQTWGPRFVNASNRATMQNQFDGDPMVGNLVPGCNSLKWEDATQTQLFLSLSYTEAGLSIENIEAVITGNAGPAEPWNFSYTQWGIKKIS